MRKLKSLIIGSLLGAGVMYAGLQYHVLLAPEGFVLVPRAPRHRLQDAYADVQTWDEQSWAARPQLSLAVMEFGRADLIGEGLKQGAADRLRDSFSPQHEQLGTNNRGWEPAGASDVPAPIAGGKVAGRSRDKSSPRRGFLSLSELFGFNAEEEQNVSADVPDKRGAITPVLPAGTTHPPEVEFLPSPDEVELGRPQPLPRRPTAGWRQSDAGSDELQRSAKRQAEWEPVTGLQAN